MIERGLSFSVLRRDGHMDDVSFLIVADAYSLDVLHTFLDLCATSILVWIVFCLLLCRYAFCRHSLSLSWALEVLLISKATLVFFVSLSIVGLMDSYALYDSASLFHLSVRYRHLYHHSTL
ncbi:hypothetical protein BDZ89DRAFT_559257 [Hymenopellis radicata]|nr:hypothetical protein BDZ89DRAFT_559257 [Hymenopellis radicata]